MGGGSHLTPPAQFSFLLPSATKLRRLYFHRRLSVHRGDLPQCMLAYQHPQGADTPRSRHPPGADTPRSRPPRSRHPPGADTPQEQTSPGADTPPPGETATAADGTHPTGMHSCLMESSEIVLAP